MQIDILSWEEIIDTWPLIYIGPSGKFNGRCTVTRRHVYFDVKPENGFSSDDTKQTVKREVRISKVNIKNVEIHKSIFRTTIIIVMDNGQRHLFRCGGVKSRRIVDAINKRA
jgi:hypothetical protein